MQSEDTMITYESLASISAKFGLKASFLAGRHRQGSFLTPDVMVGIPLAEGSAQRTYAGWSSERINLWVTSGMPTRLGVDPGLRNQLFDAQPVHYASAADVRHVLYSSDDMRRWRRLVAVSAVPPATVNLPQGERWIYGWDTEALDEYLRRREIPHHRAYLAALIRQAR